jgi:exodeoxyribonuclease-5
VFLGDIYQLPPVKEVCSKVFSNVTDKTTLEEVVRQEASNPMTEALLDLRKDVRFGNNNGLANMIKKISDVKGDSGYICYNNQELFTTSLLQFYYSTQYEHDKDYMKFLTWTNDDVKLWNFKMREELLKENSKNILNVGEVLMGYYTIINKKTNDIIIQNSEDYIVTKITEATSPDNVPGFYVELTTEEGRVFNVFIIDHNNIDSFHVQAKEKYAKAVQLRGSYWRTYLNFKEKHLSLVDVYIDPNKPKNFANLLCKKDLDYGYCLTVHKSQGSTYGNVAVNLNNIYKNYTTSERNRLIYVALSRARDMNMLLAMK